ncbi:hypothetical protein Patl1_15440 [Pistacia atlantica]|uniref:Uncharacterized protein n=1 Tax=Pistacia atlantica TaxID=434234 RepID=A0ACC1B8M2_9ROSI|nr:hypothetical protein Patl1_15440 [Pistacia atlantica]
MSSAAETDVEIKAPAKKFHDVFSCRPHHISNVCPKKIQGVDLHEVAKEIIEAMDDENNSTTFKVIERHLLEKYKNFHLIVQATQKALDFEV